MTAQIIDREWKRLTQAGPLRSLIRFFGFLLLVRVSTAFINSYEPIVLTSPIDVSFIDQFLYGIFTAIVTLVDPSRADSGNHGDSS